MMKWITSLMFHFDQIQSALISHLNIRFDRFAVKTYTDHFLAVVVT